MGAIDMWNEKAGTVFRHCRLQGPVLTIAFNVDLKILTRFKIA